MSALALVNMQIKKEDKFEFPSKRIVVFGAQKTSSLRQILNSMLFTVFFYYFTIFVNI